MTKCTSPDGRAAYNAGYATANQSEKLLSAARIHAPDAMKIVDNLAARAFSETISGNISDETRAALQKASKEISEKLAAAGFDVKQLEADAVKNFAAAMTGPEGLACFSKGQVAADEARQKSQGR